jgi:hypothetical protein
VDLTYAESSLRILDFDIECQPGAWIGSDYTTKRLLSIAAAWIVDGQPVDLECKTVRPRKGARASILRWFLTLYDEADMVTGHFIRGYDLPVLQGAYMRHHLPLLGQKLTLDTKNDLAKVSGISKSQENLGALYELKHPKEPMTTIDWEDAADLTPEGLHQLETRNRRDVEQHVELLGAMLEAGPLGAPTMWLPHGNGTSKYTP